MGYALLQETRLDFSTYGDVLYTLIRRLYVCPPLGEEEEQHSLPGEVDEGFCTFLRTFDDEGVGAAGELVGIYG